MVRKILWLVLAVLVIAGCSLNTAPTGDTASDPGSAQSLLPSVPGYNQTNANSIADAITAVGGSASLVSGNLLSAAAITQIDRMLQCYQDVGAVAANVYTQNDISSVLQGEIPRLGAVGVVNQDRVVNNFLNCAVGTRGEGFDAQAAQVQPCGGSGSVVVNNETIYYVYAATAPELCQAFQQHFDRQGTR